MNPTKVNDIIEFAHYITDLEFLDFDQEATLQWQGL